MMLIKSIQAYLLETLGIKVRLKRWNKKKKLPFFLTNTYDFYEGILLKQKCLIVVATVQITPATIKKHFEYIQKISEDICILVQETTASYNRKRLIEHKIPFIIPGNQIYLPQIGIILREHFKATKERKKSFSPATQVVLINALLNGTNEETTPSELAVKFGYTTMTMSRALDELEALEIGAIIRKGKERRWIFEESTELLWEKTKSFMQSPVKKRIWAKGKRPKIQSGLSALAKKTMIAPPAIPVYAISHDEWKKMSLAELPDQDEASFELEIWMYDPSLFANQGSVDPYSLYLSLCELDDERVESALEELI